MSYAAVTAHNAAPYSEQPHPDTGLMNTEKPTASAVLDDSAKVSVVAPEFQNNPKTLTSENEVSTEYYAPQDESYAPVPPPTTGTGKGPSKDKEAAAKKKARVYKEKAKHELDRAEEEGEHLWDVAKEQLLRPGVAGGLVGLINVGLIGYASYSLYNDPFLRRDVRYLSTLAVSSAAILGLEGFAAERYAQTPNGQAEAQRAKEEGAVIWRHTKEVVLRPVVMGGVVGLVNVGVLSAVGWYAYINWDAPRWDRRVVSAVSAGLLALMGGEGILAEQYRETH